VWVEEDWRIGGGGGVSDEIDEIDDRTAFVSFFDRGARSIERRLGYDDTDLEVAGEAPERPRAERLLFDDLLRRHDVEEGWGWGRRARAALLSAAAAVAGLEKKKNRELGTTF
jgi:hypothetical protein